MNSYHLYALQEYPHLPLSYWALILIWRYEYSLFMQICVWCWHHIMDMAEKDETEGRCPACRTPYNKEKIFGTTAKCDR